MEKTHEVWKSQTTSRPIYRPTATSKYLSSPGVENKARGVLSEGCFYYLYNIIPKASRRASYIRCELAFEKRTSLLQTTRSLKPNAVTIYVEKCARNCINWIPSREFLHFVKIEQADHEASSTSILSASLSLRHITLSLCTQTFERQPNINYSCFSLRSEVFKRNI
jgi:hypothetical protein